MTEAQLQTLKWFFSWQSGHRPLQRGITYGLDGAFPDSLQPALLRVYEWASAEWHRYLGLTSKISDTRSAQDNVIGPGTGTSRQLCQRCSDQISLSHFPQRRQHTVGLEHQYQRQAAFTGVSRSKRAATPPPPPPPYPRYGMQASRRSSTSDSDSEFELCDITRGPSRSGNSQFYDSRQEPRGRISRPDQRKVSSKRATSPQPIISVKRQKQLCIGLVHSDSGDSSEESMPSLIPDTGSSYPDCSTSSTFNNPYPRVPVS